MKRFVYTVLLSMITGQTEDITVDSIIRKMDQNLNAKSRVLTSKMVVKGRRSSRTIESKKLGRGNRKSFYRIYFTSQRSRNKNA